MVDKILKTKNNRNILRKEERKAFYIRKLMKKTLIRNSFDLPHHQKDNMTREAVARVVAAENNCSSR